MLVQAFDFELQGMHLTHCPYYYCQTVSNLSILCNTSLHNLTALFLCTPLAFGTRPYSPRSVITIFGLVLWEMLCLVLNNEHIQVPIKQLTSIANTPSL